MSSNKEDTLRQFCDVTGADEERSKFFLESSNWQLEVALSSFYEHGGNADEAPPTLPRPTPASLPTLSDSDMESPPGSPLRPQRKEKKKTSSSKFATLDTLQQESSSDEEEARKRRRDKSKHIFCDKSNCETVKHKEPRPGTSKSTKSQDSCSSDDIEKLKLTIVRLRNENNALKAEIEKLKEFTDVESEAGQAFYAGGSERSGQQIIGPGKGRKDIVTEMFKSVRERGAVVFEEEPSTARGGGRGAFAGVGYRLGQAADDHEPVTPPTAQQSSPAGGGVRMVRLRLYREGFTVDDGAPRDYADPASAEFLAAIRRGEVPAELAQGNSEVRVSLEDRRFELCPRASVSSRAFTGKGHLLGSPTPTTVGATAPVAAAPTDREANQRAAQQQVGLDDTKPVTTIQFRLADGSRLTGRFNHTHTVGDLHRYVARAEPAYQLARFALLTTFPSAELTEPTLTLKDGQLLNTTLLQRLK